MREQRRQTLELQMRHGMGALPSDSPMFGKIEGGRSWPSYFSDRRRDALKSRKLPKITFLGLRHSHASALIAQGVDIATVSHRLSHLGPAFTLSTYSHLFSDSDSKLAAAIDAVLG